VWVWTPLRPDSIASYFPGSANVTWVASDCGVGASAAGGYVLFREQVAGQIEMQSKPILVFVPQVPFVGAAQWARQFGSRYPEVKALVFAAGRCPAATQPLSFWPLHRARSASSFIFTHPEAARAVHKFARWPMLNEKLFFNYH